MRADAYAGARAMLSDQRPKSACARGTGWAKGLAVPQRSKAIPDVSQWPE